MFLYSLLVWLQATICIQTILQDFSQEVMLLFGLDLQLFLHYWLLSAGIKREKQTGIYTVGSDFGSIVQYVLCIWSRIF